MNGKGGKPGAGNVDKTARPGGKVALNSQQPAKGPEFSVNPRVPDKSTLEAAPPKPKKEG